MCGIHRTRHITWNLDALPENTVANIDQNRRAQLIGVSTPTFRINLGRVSQRPAIVENVFFELNWPQYLNFGRAKKSSRPLSIDKEATCNGFKHRLASRPSRYLVRNWRCTGIRSCKHGRRTSDLKFNGISAHSASCKWVECSTDTLTLLVALESIFPSLHRHVRCQYLPWEAHQMTHPHQKWPRLFEQHSPILKWIPGGSQTVQSCPRRRWSLATNRPTRWATRGAPQTSSYAALPIAGRLAK